MVKRSLGWTDVCLAVGLALVIAGLALSVKQAGFSETKIELVRNESIGDTQVSSKVMIDVSGAVMSPGVYETESGGRVIDILKLCGGLSAEADRDWVEANINKARIVRDGEKIYIPKIGDVLGESETSRLGMTNHAPALGITKNDKINLNTATTEQLDKLPGVGPALAGRIIDYRQENNGFVSVDEIKLVSGIGDKVFEKFKDLIIVN